MGELAASSDGLPNASRRPSFSTMMRSACATVETLDAIMTVVFPARSFLILAKIFSSVPTSTADTESSITIIGASLRYALAMDMRCF